MQLGERLSYASVAGRGSKQAESFEFQVSSFELQRVSAGSRFHGLELETRNPELETITPSSINFSKCASTARAAIA